LIYKIYPTCLPIHSTFPRLRSRPTLYLTRSIKYMSSHYLFPSSTPPPNTNADNMPTPPPVPTSRSNRSFENHPPPPLPSSVSSPTPNRSRKSFPVISQQQQVRGGSYVTPPMANGRRMTSNPVRSSSSAGVPTRRDLLSYKIDADIRSNRPRCLMGFYNRINPVYP
jgi:hypothetical protein